MAIDHIYGFIGHVLFINVGVVDEFLQIMLRLVGT